MTSVIRPGPRRHHHDPVGEVDRLGDRVGDEDGAGAGLRADPQQLVLQPLAGHLVERAERLVHQQQRRVYGQRPGDRDPLLHAAGQLGRVVPGEVGAARPGRASPAARSRRSRPAGSRAAPAAARRCAAPCATRRARPAGTRCRTPGRAGPAGPACRRPSRAGGRRDQVGDQPQQRATCRSRTGRSARRTGRARRSGRSSVSAVTSSGPAGVEDLRHTREVHGVGHAASTLARVLGRREQQVARRR